MRCWLLMSVASLFVVPQSAAAADNWPQWRGPGANGVAPAGDHPTEFSPERNAAWKVDLPGKGSSTPIVWDDAIFVTCGIDGQDGLLCYDLDGRERWRRLLGPEMPGKHAHGSGSNPSPATDGQHVVVYYKSGTVACFDLEGRELWRLNLRERYGEINMWWDLGASPVIAGDRAIVSVLHAGESYLLALDLESGDVLWKQPRQYECPVEADQSYTTPQLATVDGRQLLLVLGADHFTAHDVATGELVWECGGLNPDNQPMWRNIGSVAVADGLAIVPYGRGQHLVAVRLDGAGDVTDSHKEWEKQDVAGDVPTPVIRDGRIYLLRDDGRIVCLDLQSGDELWSADLPKSRHRYFASPVLAGDLLYSTRLDGMVFVGRITDDSYEPLAENPMGEELVVGPVPVRGGLLIRGPEHLFFVAPSAN
jgi:outer membrane protein assembly factor BamB